MHGLLANVHFRLLRCLVRMRRVSRSQEVSFLAGFFSVQRKEGREMAGVKCVHMGVCLCCGGGSVVCFGFGWGLGVGGGLIFG